MNSAEDARANGTSCALDVQGITKRFGAVAALRGVDLTLHAGEVVGLIGDNGAGKSTLVNIISGALKPDEGHIIVDGVQREFHSPADARRVGIETVFQNLALIPTLSIEANVYLTREAYAPGPISRWVRLMNKRAMRRETERGFEQFGVKLPPVRTKAVALSGGQRQMVAIGRAILWGSHIVLLDEPAAALGVKQTELVLSFVRELKSHGIGVIVISHNMQHVLQVADRVVVLRLGSKVADIDLRENPQTGAQLVAHMTGVAAA